MGEKIITGNYFDKYGSKNPVYKKLMSNFMNHLIYLIKSTKIENPEVLEVGCGDGHLADILTEKIHGTKYHGFDLDEEIVNEAKANCPKVSFSVGSVYEMPEYRNRKTDIIIVSEVLEHLEFPEKALTQLQALQTEFYLFSVPNEPIWRILNLLRFKYIKNLGNTPGHLQHWGKNSFKKLLSSYFEIVDFKRIFPWSMALCKKK